MEPFAQKWTSFGFAVSEIDGHDFGQIQAAFAAPAGGRPRCIIARTVKGKGVTLMEDKVEWHYLPMNDAQYADALADLDRAERGEGPR
jgi:transketolase